MGPLYEASQARRVRTDSRVLWKLDEHGERFARGRLPAPDAFGSKSLLLHGTGEQPLHEVALEREEDDERNRERDERRRRDQLDVGAELAQLGEDRDRDRLRVAPERQGNEQVVPDPEELEDGERGDRRQAERQDQAHEDP